MTLDQRVLQEIKKSFEDVHLDVKIYQISLVTLRNSTSLIILLVVLALKGGAFLNKV